MVYIQERVRTARVRLNIIVRPSVLCRAGLFISTFPDDSEILQTTYSFISVSFLLTYEL